MTSLSFTCRWSHIYCSAAVPLADKGVNRGTHHVNGVTDGHGTKMANGNGEVHSSSRGKCTVGLVLLWSSLLMSTISAKLYCISYASDLKKLC